MGRTIHCTGATCDSWYGLFGEEITDADVAYMTEQGWRQNYYGYWTCPECSKKEHPKKTCGTCRFYKGEPLVDWPDQPAGQCVRGDGSALWARAPWHLCGHWEATVKKTCRTCKWWDGQREPYASDPTVGFCRKVEAFCGANATEKCWETKKEGRISATTVLTNIVRPKSMLEGSICWDDLCEETKEDGKMAMEHYSVSVVQVTGKGDDEVRVRLRDPNGPSIDAKSPDEARLTALAELMEAKTIKSTDVGSLIVRAVPFGD